MALVKTFDKYELKHEFERYGRDYFSYTACDYILDYFEDIGENVELDIIALCCDFTEETAEYIKDNYSNIEEIAKADDIDELLDALSNYTWCVETEDNNILYMEF